MADRHSEDGGLDRGPARAVSGDVEEVGPAANELGSRIRRLRKAKAMTLDALAVRSGVSRAMLSKVERGEKSPTLSVASRIARGLDTSLSDLMGAGTQPAAAAIRRVGQRLRFRDEETGFERHILSPAHEGSGVELLLHVIPPGQSSGLLPAYEGTVEKHLIVREGRLTVRLGEERHVLETGDAFYFPVREPYRFVNEGMTPCSYYCLIVRR